MKSGICWRRLLMCAGALATACARAPLAPSSLPLSSPPAGAGPTTAAGLSVSGIIAQGRRLREPANFADLSETIDLLAPAAALNGAPTYEWKASLGSIEGSGPTVTWRAPSVAATPVEVTLTLKVTDAGGTTTASTEVSLHDSAKELGAMARQFLLDFSNSRLGNVSAIMRNFLPACYGTAEETAQVTANRQRFTILQWSVGDATTTVGFGGVCPFRAKRGDACTSVPVQWRSIDFQSKALGTVNGVDWLASVYSTDERRWRLCDSQFNGKEVGVTGFLR